jgi:isocitrate/isopropylmalate dehydrogenase
MAASKIAVIGGGGIGKEVAPERVRAIEAAARRFGQNPVWEHLDWDCGHHARFGRMTPEKGLDMGGTASTDSPGTAIAGAVSVHAKPRVATHG